MLGRRMQVPPNIVFRNLPRSEFIEKAVIAHIKKPIKNIFIAMGEPESSEAIARVIRDELGVKTTVPDRGDVIELE